MLLIKCKCGNFFTVSNSHLETANRISCPNCKNKFHSSSDIYIEQLKEELENLGFEINKIPDNAKITVTFDV